MFMVREQGTYASFAGPWQPLDGRDKPNVARGWRWIVDDARGEGNQKRRCRCCRQKPISDQIYKILWAVVLPGKTFNAACGQ